MEQKAEHTPGLWDKDTLEYYQCGCQIRRSVISGHTAYIRYCDMHKAAPDLLAACERAEQTIRNLARCGALDGDYVEIAENEAANLRRDIAKVKVDQ